MPSFSSLVVFLCSTYSVSWPRFSMHSPFCVPETDYSATHAAIVLVREKSDW
jgi:hypothetical protein